MLAGEDQNIWSLQSCLWWRFGMYSIRTDKQSYFLSVQKAAPESFLRAGVK